MRTTLEPNDSDVIKYYGKDNNEYDFGNDYLNNPSLGNCTWYAYGRMLELSNDDIQEKLHSFSKKTGTFAAGKAWIKENRYGQFFHTSLEEEYKEIGPVAGAIFQK